ncbi:MAG: tetratricopeptide repeat protein, partial [Prevotella sp.]|nr:tetratricopeptide repeat protein [Prevotella sp.]
MAKVKNQQPTPEATEQLAQQFSFIEKNAKTITISVIAVIVIIVGIILYNNYVVEPRENEASTAIAKGQDLFGAQQFEVALNGDSATFKGFVALASEYSDTKAGNHANLYAGLCYAKLDKWTEAAQYIEKFDTQDDKMISPAAIGALGNVYAHLEQLDKAVETLKKAAKMADNNSLSPTFLIQAGEILES